MSDLLSKFAKQKVTVPSPPPPRILWTCDYYARGAWRGGLRVLDCSRPPLSSILKTDAIGQKPYKS